MSAERRWRLRSSGAGQQGQLLRNLNLLVKDAKGDEGPDLICEDAAHLFVALNDPPTLDFSFFVREQTLSLAAKREDCFPFYVIVPHTPKQPRPPRMWL